MTPTSIRQLSGLLVILVLAFAVFLAPVPTDQHMVEKLARLAPTFVRGPRQLAVVGNSVIDHVSKCDTDTRTVAQLLRTDGPVLDMSYGGQTFEESLSLGALALKSKSVSDIVFFVSTTGLSDHDSLDLQTSLFFRLADGAFDAFNPAARLERGVGLAAAQMDRMEPFAYGGTTYPDYNGIKARFFDREQRHVTCPESAAVDATFVEAYNWKQLAEPTPWMPHLDDLARLEELAERRGKTLTVVLLPIDFPDIARMRPDVQTQIRRNVETFKSIMRDHRIAMLDASDILRDGQFADRYCACGHLDESGRRSLADFVRLNGGPSR